MEDWLKISKTFKKKYLEHESLKGHSNMDIAVMLDTTQDEFLKTMAIGREMVNTIQRKRKSAGLNIEDDIEVFYDFPKDSFLEKVLVKQYETIKIALKVSFQPMERMPKYYVKIGDAEFKHENETGSFCICNTGIIFDDDKIKVRI